MNRQKDRRMNGRPLLWTIKFGQLIDASSRPFFTFNMDRRTDQQAYFPIEIQFYISAMFLGFPDKIHEEKPSFFQSKKRTDGWTDRPTDRRTDRPSYRDARTHLKNICIPMLISGLQLQPNNHSNQWLLPKNVNHWN